MRNTAPVYIHLNLNERNHWSRSLLPGVIAALRERPGIRVMNHESLSLQEVWQAGRGTAMGFLGMFTEEQDGPFLDELRREGIPVLNLSGRSPPVKIPSLLHDDLAIGRMAAEHLLQPGQKNYAFFGLPGSRLSARRHQGFAAALQEQGFSCEAYLHERRHDSIASWLKRLPRPVAVFAATDTRARALCQRVEQLGLRMPEEIRLVGVDNDPFQCDLHLTSLSSVEPDFYRLGFRAGQIIQSWVLEGEEPSPGESYIAPLNVEVRMSSDPWHTRDPLLTQAIRRMKDPVAEVHSVAILSRQLGVSRRSLELRCKAEFGQSPLFLLNRIKLERAYQLLSHTELELHEVMERVGFRDQRHFRRQFRERFGRGPTELRKV